MTRPSENIVYIAFLYFTSGVHDDHTFSHFGYGTHVVCNQNDSRVCFFSHRPHQIKYLCLDCDIQSRSGFVSNQDFRTTGKRHSDHDALAHSTGQLVGIVVNSLCR